MSKSSRFRFVTLHTKTAVLFVVGLAGIIFSSLFLTRYFFLFSLNELENIEIHKSSSQAFFVIESLSTRQEEASYDWAYWTESYDLLTQKDSGFEQRNLNVEILDTLGLDFMTFLTAKNEFVAGIARTKDNVRALNDAVVSDQGVAQHLTAMKTKLDRDKTSASGLVRVGDNIWVVSITPIRNGSSEQPYAGWMIWGQHLSLRFPSNFEDILTANNSIITDASVIERFGSHSTPMNQLDPHDDSAIFRTPTELYHYTSLRDISGREIAVLKTLEQRTYYQKGESVFYYLIFAIIGVTGVVSVVTFILFRINVGKRFNYFEQDIKALVSGNDADLGEHKDEFERITRLVKRLAATSQQTEGRLKDTLQKFDALYHSQTLGMVLVIERNIKDVNQALLNMLGYKRDDLVGKDIETLCAHSSDAICSVEQLFRNLNQGLRQFEAGLVNSYGDTVFCVIEATQFTQHNKTAVMLSIKDISEQKQQAVLIDSLTHRDTSTGLLNRPTVINTIKGIFQKADADTPYVMLYFNASRLKEIDEIYGHTAHEEVLKHIADTLMKFFGTENVGRISESEFVVWGEQSRYRDVRRRANAVLNIYSRKIEFLGFDADIGLKGVLLPSSISFDSFENFSYVGLYALTELQSHAKNVLITVDENLIQRSKESLTLNRDIAQALNNDEIFAYYQPIVNASSGQVVGFEALARWQHPSLGMVSPATFIPLAEQRRLIVELGELILEQACRFISQFQQQSTGLSQNKLSIHVNLSTPHFHHKRLVETLVNLIEKYSLSPGQLVLELTESILLGTEDEIIERMDVIKSLGVQLALDDFGTGYSSFSSLCNFPLDIVKLDKSYIDSLESNDKAKSLVRNIIHMSQELGMTTVAEGVENASQLRKLNVWNVDEIQGYYFFKPMDKETILDRFTRGNLGE